MNAYDKISIWFYVRFDYWRNRFWMWHHENVEAVICELPQLEKYRRFLGVSSDSLTHENGVKR